MKTAWLLVCAALSAAAAGEAPVTASARLENGQVVVAARNVSDKKIAAYTLVVRGVDAAGRPGPKAAHTEVMVFSPQIQTGRHKDGWLPGESVTVQPRGSMRGPGGSMLEKYTVSCDYILFVDGSRWGRMTNTQPRELTDCGRDGRWRTCI